MQRRLRACFLVMVSACSAQDLHFKTRTIRHDGGLSSETTAVHKVVQYDHPPGTAEIEALLREGIVVVGALPDTAIVVSAPGGTLRGADNAIWTGRIEAQDKISPAFSQDLTKDESLTALVEFHNDVTPEQQEAVAGAARLILTHSSILQGDHGLVTGSIAAFRRLAEYDEVAYIFPADPDLTSEASGTLLTCAGMLTTNGAVGQYATIVHGWNVDPDGYAHLTYLFGSITPKVPASLVQSEVLRALNEWAKVTNLTFQQGSNPAGARNIVIKFVSGAHGDSYPFDGPKNSLAHTFYPVPVNPETVAGDMHLDADENWQAGGDPDIFSVALHEAGHAIGLGHSDKPGDVMYPYYRSRSTLSANDIRAARTLYGVPSGGMPTTTTPAPVTQPAEPNPLRLTLDAVPASTRADTVALSGTLTGGKDPVAVQWQTANGATGRANVSGATSRAWTTSAIPLATGENTISISAFDAAALSTSAVALLTRAAATNNPATQPVSISIKTPAPVVTTVSGTAMSLAGVALGAITRVTWQTSGGAAGVAAGTSAWLAAGVPLLRGTNTIVVRAWDEKGSTAWASKVVIRR